MAVSSFFLGFFVAAKNRKEDYTGFPYFPTPLAGNSFTFLRRKITTRHFIIFNKVYFDYKD